MIRYWRNLRSAGATRREALLHPDIFYPCAVALGVLLVVAAVIR